jgi:HlyD family secretion protein
MTDPSQGPNRRRLWITGTIIIAAIVMISLMAKYHTTRRSGSDSENLTFSVRRGPLVISLTESGTIQAQNRIIIKNLIPGSTTILWIIDEGAQAKKGELLVELDASNLQDRLFERQIKVQNADAQFVRAREDLAITQNQAESDIEKAETDLSFAQQDLEKYVKGEYPQLLREAEVRITLAEEDLQRAEEKLKWSRVLFEEKFVSQTELQADELSERKADLDLELARGKKDLLEKHTNKRELAALESDLKQTGMALERVRRKAKANIVQSEADFTAKEMEFSRQSDKLKEVQEQIAATRILAPSDGLVLYATSAQRGGRHRSNSEPLSTGRQVHEREALIHLPDTSKMMASIKVHETHVKKILQDMPARITVDALPNKVFSGHVAHIAPLPDATSFWMNPDLKVYNTEVYVDNNAEGLRNGMTCEVEIIAETHPDALHIPIQAVVRIGGKPTVFVAEPKGSVTPREIKVGGDNNRMIHVLEGLSEGEQVLLTPPLRDSEREPQKTSRSAPNETTKQPPAASEKQRAPKRKR